jgi:hypothetical protein
LKAASLYPQTMTKMNKRPLNITSLAELEQEEQRVRRRIRQRERELIARSQKLPEEMLTAGVVQLISAVAEGHIFRRILRWIRKTGQAAFFEKFL